MKKFNLLIVILLTFSLISSCETNEDNKLIGGLIGAAVGAYVGSEIGSGVGKSITTIIGGTLGYYLGTKIAYILNEDEQKRCNESIEKTLNETDDQNSNQWISKTNPDKRGIITPLKSYSQNDKDCRDFKKVIINNEESIEEISKACRDIHGNWQVIEG